MNQPYTFTEPQLDALHVMATATADERAALAIFEESYPDLDVRELLIQFMRLAKSLEANAREMVATTVFVELGRDPEREGNMPNLPTICGAIAGYRLATKARPDPLCDGCAYRLGTPANQSPVTTCDADYSANNSREPFLCHERLNRKGMPYQACSGYAQQHKIVMNGP